MRRQADPEADCLLQRRTEKARQDLRGGQGFVGLGDKLNPIEVIITYPSLLHVACKALCVGEVCGWKFWLDGLWLEDCSVVI